MGVKYPILHPEPLYTLATVLSIYSSKLKSHNDEINAIIEGSLEFFMSVAGAVRNLIQRFRDGAMPRILGSLFPKLSGCEG